jgi:hypothetical protein
MKNSKKFWLIIGVLVLMILTYIDFDFMLWFSILYVILAFSVYMTDITTALVIDDEDHPYTYPDFNIFHILRKFIKKFNNYLNNL